MEWNCWKQQPPDHWKAPPLPLCRYWGFSVYLLPLVTAHFWTMRPRQSLKLSLCRDYWQPALPATGACLCEIFQDSQTLMFPKLQLSQQQLQALNQAQEDTNTVMGKSSRKSEYLEQHRAQSGHVDIDILLWLDEQCPHLRAVSPFLGPEEWLLVL